MTPGTGVREEDEGFEDVCNLSDFDTPNLKKGRKKKD